MGRDPRSGKAVRNINTTVEAEVVKAEELKRPEVVEIQPNEKETKRTKVTNKFGGK